MRIGHSSVGRYDSSGSITEDGQGSGNGSDEFVGSVEENVVSSTVQWEGSSDFRISSLVKYEYKYYKKERDRSPFASDEHDKSDGVEARASDVISYRFLQFR